MCTETYKLSLFLKYIVGEQMQGACKALDAHQQLLEFFAKSN